MMRSSTVKARLGSWLGLGILLGAYLWIVAVVVIAIAMATVLWPQPGWWGPLVLLVLFLLPIAYSFAPLWRGVTHEPSGIVLGRTEHPAIWADVNKAASIAGTRPPDELRLVGIANAGVTEDSRWLGLVAGTRRLVIGVPLLQSLSRAELLALLSHEMGHYSGRHTALASLTRRGLIALAQASESLGPRTIAGRVFAGFFHLYARVTSSASRQQEFDADRAAAAAVGPDVVVKSLRSVAEIAHHYDEFTRDYGWVAAPLGRAPEFYFWGFATYLSEPSRATGLLIDQILAAEELQWWDTHPPTRDRIARLESMTGVGPREPIADGDIPALALLAEAPKLVRQLEEQMADEAGLVFDSWETSVRDGSRRRAEERAVVVMRLADQVLGEGVADLSSVVSAICQGRGGGLAAALAGQRLDATTEHEVLTLALEDVVAAALLSTGQAGYALWWDTTDALYDDTGQHIAVRDLVDGLPGNPSMAEWLLEMLREEGVSRTWTPGISGPDRSGPTGPEVLTVAVARDLRRASYQALWVTDAGLAVRRMGLIEMLGVPPLGRPKNAYLILDYAEGLGGTFLVGDDATEIIAWSDVEHVTFLDGTSPTIRLRIRGEKGQRRFRVETGAVSGVRLFDALARFNHGRMSLS
jgi:Zn-dependent protease with chaperone function